MRREEGLGQKNAGPSLPEEEERKNKGAGRHPGGRGSREDGSSRMMRKRNPADPGSRSGRGRSLTPEKDAETWGRHGACFGGDLGCNRTEQLWPHLSNWISWKQFGRT